MCSDEIRNHTRLHIYNTPIMWLSLKCANGSGNLYCAPSPQHCYHACRKTHKSVSACFMHGHHSNHRAQVSDKLSVDVALLYNEADSAFQGIIAVTNPSHVVFPERVSTVDRRPPHSRTMILSVWNTWWNLTSLVLSLPLLEHIINRTQLHTWNISTYYPNAWEWRVESVSNGVSSTRHTE